MRKIGEHVVNQASFAGLTAMADADRLSPDQLNDLARRCHLPVGEPDCIERHRAVCTRLSICRRSLTNLVLRGVLTPVRFPGSDRAIGFRRSDVDALLRKTGGAA